MAKDTTRQFQDEPFDRRHLDPSTRVDTGPEPATASAMAAAPVSAMDTTASPAAERALLGLSAADLCMLRRHVVNLRQGAFATDGQMDTTPSDVDALFFEHLEEARAAAQRRKLPLKVLFYAHGGLTSESDGLKMARTLVPWWVQNGVYPIYFVWETGFWETIGQLLQGRRELSAARDLFDLTDRPLEELARKLGGGKLWDGMKLSAQRSVDADGGARYVAHRLGQFCGRYPKQVELHAVGHSAGSIFHSYFVPVAREQGAASFRTLSLLAPAIRVSEFLTRLQPQLDAGVDALTMYTMKKDFERADSCGAVYRKSLLYLVSNAFEARRGEPILGLEESIRSEAKLAPIFGLGGQAPAKHQIVWSQTAQLTGRSASRSTTHGGFDNDAATMQSVLRRVLDIADDAAIAPFPAEAARALGFKPDAALAPSVTSSANVASAVSALGTSAWSGPAPLTPASPQPCAPAGSGSLRALCVGINNYPEGAALGGCVADAQRWAAELKTLGFQVDLVTDAAATQAGLRDKLGTLIESGRPGDVLVFQYAGHGTYFEDYDGDEADHQDEALVPVDFNEAKFILDDELFDLFSKLRDGVALTAFLDCCHSGTMSRFALQTTLHAARENDVRPRFINPTPAMVQEYQRRREASRSRGFKHRLRRRELPFTNPDSAAHNAAERQRGRDAQASKCILFSACRDDEVALERAGHGVFTSLAAPLLRQQFAAGTTNEQFQQAVLRAFGATRSQNPQLDCADRFKALPLLQAPAPPPQGEPVAAPNASAKQPVTA